MCNLPPGITDIMLESDDPVCGDCGHIWSEHLEEKDIVYDEDGTPIDSCGILRCECNGFCDDDEDPEVDWWDD